MTTHEDVNRRYSELQSLLRDYFQAEGRGLIEMSRSVETRLDSTVLWELRAIGHIRNQVVHEGLQQVPRYFEPLCKEALANLKRLKPRRRAVKRADSSVSKTPPKPTSAVSAKPVKRPPIPVKIAGRTKLPPPTKAAAATKAPAKVAAKVKPAGRAPAKAVAKSAKKSPSLLKRIFG